MFEQTLTSRMNLLGATGKPITEEYKELFGDDAYAWFDKEDSSYKKYR